MSAPLTLALSKGRIFEETLPLLAAAGVQVAEDPETSRKLAEEHANFAIRKVTEPEHIYPVFRDLFKKEGETA